MNNFRKTAAVKVISWILIAALSLSSFSELAYAADISPAEKAIKEDEVTEENITEKSESTTTYYLGEGKNMTVWHGGQVRFEDEDGNLTDYEPQLEEIEKEKTLQGKDLKGYSFTNKEGDAKHYLPEKIGEDAPLIMEKEDLSIEMSLADETVKMLGLEDAQGLIKEETVQTITGEEKLPVTAVYENKDSASLALTSTADSVKETITLLEKPESSVLKYEIKLSGLTARKNVLDEGITYYDREKNIAGYMASPWMNDASGKNYSENIKCTLKKSDEKGKYIVEMHIDEEYLSSEETQYPVVIDPTNTWQGNSQIRDAYVISGSTYGDINFYDSGTKKMPVGKNNTGTHRTYLKLYDLYAVTKGCSVTSAKLTVYETGSGQAGQSIGICRVPSSWEPADITNNNRPVGTTLYSSITSKGTEGSSSVFDILTYVKNVASGSITNYGLMLYNKMDNPGIATFYGSRTGDTAKRPKLVVTYYSIPTTATSAQISIKEGKKGGTAEKTVYVQDSSHLKLSFSGITSNGLKRVEQRLRYWDDASQKSGEIYIDYGENSAVTNGSTMRTLPEGCYVSYIRGVNMAGAAGESKTAGYMHIDKTKPVIESFSVSPASSKESPINSLAPKIAWKVNDKHFGKVRIYVNGELAKSGLKGKEGSFTFSDFNSFITGSGIYEIKIQAEDWSGNVTESSTLKYYVDTDEPQITEFTAGEGETAGQPTKNAKPHLTWNIDEDFIEKIELFVDDKKIEDILLTNTSTEYTLKEGVIENSGKHEIKLCCTDIIGNVSESILEYYTDFDKPTIEEVKIIPDTGILNPSNNRSPQIFWEASDEIFSEIKLSINQGEYITIGNTIFGKYTVPSDVWESAGAYTLNIKAVDKAGNESQVKSLTYHLSDGGEYRPLSFKVEESYGKRVLSWKLDRYDKREVAFDVYRGGAKDFVLSDETLIAEDIDAGSLHFIDSQILEDGTYFYKICVKDRDSGNMLAATDEKEVTVAGLGDSFSSKNGLKDYLSYEDVKLPTGTASIEKSSGTLNFTQSDFTLSNPQFEYGLQRCYSQNRAYSSMVGFGWLDSYHMELYKKGEDYLFVESSGSIYLFEKDKGYLCDETKEYTLSFDEENLPKITLKDGTIYCFNSFGQLTCKEEPNGCMIVNSYDETGRLVSVISKSDETTPRNLKFTYEEDSRLLKEITDFEETVYSYSFTDKNLTETKIARGSESVEYEYGYNQNGKLSIILDGEGNQYSFIYENERVREAVYPDGEKVSFSYTDQGENVKTLVTKTMQAGEEISQTETALEKDTGKVMSFKDAFGNMESYTYTGYFLTSKVSEKEYESLNDGKVTVNSSQVTTTYDYDSNGNMESEESSTGSKSEYLFDDKGNITSETVTEDGKIISKSAYSYDSNGNMQMSVDYVQGEVEYFSYNEDGNETQSSIKERRGISSYSLIEPESQSLSPSWAPAAVTTSESLSGYDEYGNMQISSQTSGKIKSKDEMTYDKMGRAIKSVSNGITTAYEYDFLGREIKTVVSEEGKDDIITVKSYDKNGSLKSESSTAGTSNTYIYDSRNRNTQKFTSGSGIASRSETVSYSSQTDLEVNTGKGKKRIPFVYVKTTFNSSGQEVSREYTDCEGKAVRTLTGNTFTDNTYDNSGNCITTCTGYISSGVENVDTVSLSLFDIDGNVTAEIKNPEVSDGDFKTSSQSIVTTNKYDEKANLIEKTDAKEISTKFTYDDEGQMTSCDIESGKESDPVDLSITYSTDQNGSKTAVITDANGNLKKEITDASGLLLGTYDISKDLEEDTLSREYIYDKLGRVEMEKYEDGSFIKYSYDGNSERISSKFAFVNENVLESRTEFSYDISGNVICETKYDENDIEVYRKESSYDCEGKVLSSQVWYSGVNEGKIEYSYDIEGRLVSKKYPENLNLGTVTFSYDHLGKVTSVSKGNAKVRDYVYDQAGKLTETREYFDNSSYVSTLYGYDSLNRAVSIFYKDGENVLESFEYIYDKNDNVLQMHRVNNMLPEEKNLTETRSYSYDNLGNLTESSSERLSGENSITSVIEYAYDDAGNRISETVDGNETSYIYNGLNQLVSSTSGGVKTEYKYDKRGNQVLKSSTDGKVVESKYAVTGEMLSLTESIAGSDEEKTVTLTQENEYNADGQRIRKSENGETTQYVYDDGAAAYTKAGENTVSNVLSLEGSVIGSIQNDEYSAYFKDMQGSTSSIAGPGGELKAAYRYSDFGETLEISDSSYSNEICYTGAVYDDSTGLYYMNARYYSPEDGRFISQDSYRGEKDDPGQWHLYTYCANNPINYIDPSGHMRKHWYNSVKWVGRFIDAAITIYGGVSAITAYKALRKINPKTFSVRVKRILDRKVSKNIKKAQITAALDIVWIFTDSSIGKVIAKGLDYVDKWWGYKRNNGYILN